MQTVVSFPSFADLPQRARALFEAAGASCFFDGIPWFETFSKYACDPGDRIRIYCAGGEATPQAALATVSKTANTGLLKPRKLSSLSSYYTSLFSVVGADDDIVAGARQLAEAIARELPQWDEVELRPLDVSGPAFAALVKAFKGAGFVVQTYFCFGNWYLDVAGRSFSQYADALPSALKNTLHRKRKKLEKSGRSKFELVTGPDHLESAIDAYNQVYLASWKQPEPYRQFVPELIRTCAALGVLRLGLMYVDEQPAAAQLWIVQNGFALIYKLAYDERFADLSVGTVLTAKMFEHAIDVDCVHTIDYLTGDDPYKKDWMSHRRERWGMLAMNPKTIRGASAILRHVGGRAVKRFAGSLARRAGKPASSSQAA